MNKKGISLITLIITIIVIIILASAIIVSLNNTNIIGNANKAVSEQEKSSIIDSYNLLVMDNMIAAETGVGEVKLINLEILSKKVGIAKERLQDKFRVNKETGNLEEKFGEVWNEISKTSEKYNIYTRKKSESRYNRPYIPKEFDYLEGTWNTGLVIKNREDLNEFVWIPVKKNVGNAADEKYYYKKRNFNEFSVDFNQVEDDNEYPLNADQKAADKLVEKHGGFYIGRYESGNQNGKLLVQASKGVYNAIGYDDARRLADSLYESDPSKNYISTLTTGKQWDTACSFLGSEYANNSEGNGNYSNNMNNTAHNGYKTNNVYDMAGNCWEWTVERLKQNPMSCIIRGGSFNNDPVKESAGCRYFFDPRVDSKNFSFRISLYIK